MKASNITGTAGPTASLTVSARVMLACIPSGPLARPWTGNHFWPANPAAASSFAIARTVTASCGTPRVLT